MVRPQLIYLARRGCAWAVGITVASIGVGAGVTGIGIGCGAWLVL
ncbi:hypothetical protein [Streptomyces roseus]|nr:hypothetical protein [Streptomyces roseus]